MTDQGSHCRNSRTALMGISITAEKALKAGPKTATVQSMAAFSHGVIGKTQASGYSISHLAASDIKSMARVSAPSPAQIMRN